MKIWWTVVALLGTPAWAQEAPEVAVEADEAVADAHPDPGDLLDFVDKNLVFETRTTTVTMTVVNPRRTREFQMVTYGRGEDEAAIEYLAPTRDKGTRMLRNGDEMWMYMPAVERTQKISGHMLRQGMMGSDVSYEDMVSANSWRESYTATVLGSEDVGGEACWKVELRAVDASVTYPKRVSFIHKTLHIPVKQELYALSGMLLKTWTMGDIKEFPGGRQFPTSMVISDQLQQGTHTTLLFTDIEFGVQLESEVFSRRWLERG